MGTKANPGQFDCYASAAPDEPMFVLLGRDRHAAALVRIWAMLRTLDGEDFAIVSEAQACAKAMAKYCKSCGKEPVTVRELITIDGDPRHLLALIAGPSA